MAIARQNFETTILGDHSNARIGDIREALLYVDEQIDFLLLRYLGTDRMDEIRMFQRRSAMPRESARREYLLRRLNTAGE